MLPLISSILLPRTASSSLTSLRADPLPPQHAFLFLPFARRYLLEVPRIPLVLLSP